MYPVRLRYRTFFLANIFLTDAVPQLRMDYPISTTEHFCFSFLNTIRTIATIGRPLSFHFFSKSVSRGRYRALGTTIVRSPRKKSRRPLKTDVACVIQVHTERAAAQVLSSSSSSSSSSLCCARVVHSLTLVAFRRHKSPILYTPAVARVASCSRCCNRHLISRSTLFPSQVRTLLIHTY